MQTVPRALVILAHQDDEYFIASALRGMVAHGRKPVVVYLTSGGSRTAPKVRNLESTNMLGGLGIRSDHIHFLGSVHQLADGQLQRNLDAAYRVVSDFCSRLEHVEAVYMPAWEGGHHDHDSCHVLAFLAARRFFPAAQIWQFPMYHGLHRKIGVNVFAPLAENGQPVIRKLPLAERWTDFLSFRHYPSQFWTWIRMLPFVGMYYLRSGEEQLQPVSRERMGCRPHAGELFYERLYGVTYEEVRSEVDRLLRARDESDAS